MDGFLERRRPAFVTAFVLLALVSLAVARLPEIFVAQWRRSRPLTGPQAGWAYRLLVIAALAQAAYGGFAVLRAERVAEARGKDPRLQRMDAARITSSASWTAAVLAVLTLVYGIAALALTGERAGFWLFALLALLQGAWYYREVGETGRRVARQDAGEGGRARPQEHDETPPALEDAARPDAGAGASQAGVRDRRA